MKSLRQWLHSPLCTAALISTAVFLAVTICRNTGNLESTELAVYDAFLRSQPKASRTPARVSLVTITERDIAAHGAWPLSDAKLAEALKIISSFQPRAIGLDIYRDIPLPPGHEELTEVLARNPHIIGVMKFGEGGVAPPPVLAGAERFGFNDLLVDPGGTVRRGLLFLDDGERTVTSFALRLALLYLKEAGIEPRPDPLNPQHMLFGPNTIKPWEADDGPYVGADARGYQFLLDFKDAPGSFDCSSLASLLSGEEDGARFAGRVVIVGTAAESVKDFFYTPHSLSMRGVQEVPGIVVHAHAVSQLLRLGLGESPPLSSLSGLQELLWQWLWCALGALWGMRVKSLWRFTMATLGGVVLLAGAAFGVFLLGWWIPLVPPAAGWLGSMAGVTAYVSGREKRERAMLMQIFRRHVSAEVAEEIWRHREEILHNGRLRPRILTATILFSDLQGFTDIAERMDPQVLIDWLNSYMERMARLVSQHGGIVDDYAGDGLKADFGVPFVRASEDEIAGDASNAVRCALAMAAELSALNSLWRQQGLPAVGLRIGIHTGPVLVGTLGGSQRVKYTSVGNTVNVASRLESFDKELSAPDPTGNPCRILVSEATRRHLGEQFTAEKIADTRLRGQSQSTSIYTVTGPGKGVAREETEGGMA